MRDLRIGLVGAYKWVVVVVRKCVLGVWKGWWWFETGHGSVWTGEREFETRIWGSKRLGMSWKCWWSRRIAVWVYWGPREPKEKRNKLKISWTRVRMVVCVFAMTELLKKNIPRAQTTPDTLFGPVFALSPIHYPVSRYRVCVVTRNSEWFVWRDGGIRHVTQHLYLAVSRINRKRKKKIPRAQMVRVSRHLGSMSLLPCYTLKTPG